MAMTRVVVTGLGVVSPLGLEISGFWDALTAGRSGVGPITIIPTERLAIRIAGQIADFNPQAHFDSRQLGLLDRFSQFALVAARQAVAQSGLSFAGELGSRTATILGSGVGGLNTADESFQRLYGQNAQRVHPFTIPRLMINAAGSQVSMAFGLTGPAFAVASACASATHAIGLAFQMVRSGAVTAAVTGGTEACITVGTLKGWEALRVMSPDACRPFSRNRNGMVLGEGAAVLVLESLEHARARGAEILGEIAGVGMTADAGDITAPSVDGASRAILLAMQDAGLAPEDVDYVNAHGTGTAANDNTETRALHVAFGAHAPKLAISSSKSMFGHALGAAGALEAAVTVLAIRNGVAPPTINYQEPDPACDLDCVPNTARAMPIRAALSNSFAFGGLNAVLAFRRFGG